MMMSILRALAESLHKHNISFTSYFRARVPLLKIADPSSALRCDLVYHDDTAHRAEKTALLTAFVRLDARVAPFIRAIKQWAMVRDMGDASKGGMNSFSWTLLAIHALQRVQPAILPSVSEAGALTATSTASHPDAMDVDVPMFSAFQPAANSMTHPELLRFFFSLYTDKFQPGHQAISVRAGQFIPLNESFANDAKAHGTALFVEDPFDEHDNTARTVSAGVFRTIRHELLRGLLLTSPAGTGGKDAGGAAVDPVAQLMWPVPKDAVIQAMFF
jgi:DNA polymerase sigma